MKTKRQIWGDTLGLALAALGVLIALNVKYNTWNSLPANFTGAGGFWVSARRWALEGHCLDSFRPPLYPFLLGLVMKISPESAAYHAAAGLQLTALVAILALVWRLAPAPGPGRLPWLRSGAVALAGCDLAASLEFLSMRETVFFSLILMTVYATLKGWPSHRRCAALGLLGAAAWLTRPTGVAVIAALFGALALAGGPAPQRLKRLGVFTLAASAPIALWAGYQAAGGGPIHISGAYSGINLLKGNNPYYPIWGALADVDHLDGPLGIAQFVDGDPLEGDRLARRAALDYWRADPAGALAALPTKAAGFLFPWPHPMGDCRFSQRPGGQWGLDEYNPLCGKSIAAGLPAIPIVLLFVLALARLPRLGMAEKTMMAVIGLVLAIHLISFGETRFRLPFEPLMILLGAAALDGAAKERKS